MHFLLSLLSGFLGGISRTLFIIVFVVLLIINWKIAVPALLFVIYISLASERENEKGRWRFHTLWWIFLIMVTAGIIYSKQILRIADHLLNEADTYDNLAESYITNSDPYTSTYQLPADTLIAPNSNLFGQLKVGMTPLAVLPHIWEIDDYNPLHVNKVHLNNFDRYYHNNRLYAVGFTFSTYNAFNEADTLVHFFTQKYGTPHYQERHTTYTVRWQYRDKHIQIQADTQSREGTLYIYHPQILAQKTAEIARQRQQQLDELIRKEQEKKESVARKIAEEQQKQEEKNRRLQDSF